MLPHLGEILALSCALVWALSVIFFKKSGEHVHPLALNLFKNVLAIVLLVPTIWIAGALPTTRESLTSYGIVFLSGILGIGIADTLFFTALNRLGAGLMAVIDCLYGPTVITLSVLWLGETMRAWQWVGVLMIVSAVLVATIQKPQGTASPADVRWGITYAIAAILLVAIGVVIVKPELDKFPLLWVTEMRLSAGAAVLLVVLLFHRGRKSVLQSLLVSGRRGYTFFGSLLGAYVSMILWLGGMKYTQASIAAALNQTSNIFIFLMAAMFLKEPINLRRAIGITLGVGGAYLVMFA